MGVLLIESIGNKGSMVVVIIERKEGRVKVCEKQPFNERETCCKEDV